jgi:hypothetical protein
VHSACWQVLFCCALSFIMLTCYLPCYHVDLLLLGIELLVGCRGAFLCAPFQFCSHVQQQCCTVALHALYNTFILMLLPGWCLRGWHPCSAVVQHIAFDRCWLTDIHSPAAAGDFDAQAKHLKVAVVGVRMVHT